MADKDEVEPTDESSTPEPSSVDGSDDVEPTDDALADGGPAGRAIDPTTMTNSTRSSATSRSTNPIPTTSGDSDDDKVLAGVGAGAAGAAATKRAARKSKDAPTNKRDQLEKPERTTPPKFIRQSVGELRKVVYPTGQQLINYFVVVLVFVLFVIAYVSLLDLGLGQLIFKIFS